MYRPPAGTISWPRVSARCSRARATTSQFEKSGQRRVESPEHRAVRNFFRDGGMASKAATTAEATETREEAAEAPLLDIVAAAIKKMLARGRERGYVTYDELNAALPPDQVSSEQIEDTMTTLSELGVSVIEGEDNDEPAAAEAEEGEGESRGNLDDDDIGRTDDPVRMYLREMGSVELLSREGEIAIAKRIEAGRDTMIRGLCESALTFEAIMVWRDELAQGRILLREVIDLEQTYGGQVAQALSDEAVAGEAADAEAAVESEEAEEGAAPPGVVDDDDFDDGAGPTISAMEAELREGVMITLDAIAAEFEAFRRLQEKLVERRLRGQDLTEEDRRAYQAATTTIVQHLKTLKLNNNRIE